MPTLFTAVTAVTTSRIVRAAVLLASSALAVACGGSPREVASPVSYEAWTPPGSELVVSGTRLSPADPVRAAAAAVAQAPQTIRPNHHVARSLVHSGRYAP